MHIYITNNLVLMFDNKYKEIEASSKGNYLEKGSKFISYAIKVKTNTQVKEKLDKIKKIEKSANHYCYAYVLHPDKSATYFKDLFQRTPDPINIKTNLQNKWYFEYILNEICEYITKKKNEPNTYF